MRLEVVNYFIVMDLQEMHQYQYVYSDTFVLNPGLEKSSFLYLTIV